MFASRRTPLSCTFHPDRQNSKVEQVAQFSPHAGWTGRAQAHPFHRSCKITLAIAFPRHYSDNMKLTNEERSRYKITDSHRNQTFVGLLKRDRDGYVWTWKGHIDFADGENCEFASQRTFATAMEAEDYLRRFACARIDSRLSLM